MNCILNCVAPVKHDEMCDSDEQRMIHVRHRVVTKCVSAELTFLFRQNQTYRNTSCVFCPPPAVHGAEEVHFLHDQ